MDILVQHTVRDFDEWKTAFDGNEQTRAKFGCTGHTIYRDPGDRNEVSIMTSWQSRDGAEQYMADPSLPATMEKGGVISEPRITMFEQEEARRYSARRAA